MTTRSLLALAALALAVTACGSDGPTENNGGNGGSGSFSGTISGDVSKSLSGEAVFGSSALDEGFGIFLGNEDDGFIFGRETAGVLAVGTHTVFDLVNGDEEAAPASTLVGVLAFSASGVDYICAPDGGTVTITSSSSSRLAGSVNVTAECVSAGSEATKAVRITGNFTAVGGDID